MLSLFLWFKIFFFFLIFSTIQSRNCSIAWRYNFHQTVQICSWISGIVLASNVIFEGIFSWIQKSTYLAFEFDLENIWKCPFRFSFQRAKAFSACLRQNLFYRVIDFEGNHRNILKKNPIVQKKSKKLDGYSPLWFIRIGKEKHSCPKILHSKRVKLKIITQWNHTEQKIIIGWKKEPVNWLCPFQKAKI